MNTKVGNTQLSKLKGNDLRDFINILKSFQLILRSNININKNDTFGLEIEFENCSLDKVRCLIEEYVKNDWVLKVEGSIKNGGEINTPIMIDDTLFWYQLDDLCKIIDGAVFIGKNSAAHIHIGGQIFESEASILNFLKVWAAYEDIIFRFSYGEFEYFRPMIPIYAKPCAYKFLKLYDKLQYSNIDEIISKLYLDGGRCAANFKIRSIDNFRQDNTIEFRCPNGTTNSVIWQNNVNFFTKLIYACNSDKIDIDKVDFRIRENLFNTNGYAVSLSNLLNIYTRINEEKALEFCDLIFNNNLDKLYFLRQYYKSFENIYEFKKAKQFVM